MNIATDKQRPTNHLQHETSPYLLQHAHNPVDWYPWGEEALHKAKQEDKPIFLSIGYSACHWCHVMAHESFENEAIAALLKEHFVSIKVDREERPDLDDIYMTAVVAIAGRGGWPMSVFLTPDQKPFYGGTYYPPEDRYGMPGFPTVLKSLTQAWQEKRADIEKSADSLTQYLDANLAAEEKTVGSLSPDLIRNAVAQLHQQFDGANGGWGSAPKFPSSGSIALLLREYYRTQDEKALHMATVTLDKMACGGMYDHVGGGFHRYAVDAEWRVPHFEKMLYDNAQLSRVYLEAYQLTGKDFYRHIAEETFDYILRDMTNAQGGFYSAEDADSEGEEGKFYLWTYGELGKILGEDTSEAFMAHYTIRPEGNFSSPEAYHDGFNIPHIADAVPDEDHYFTESRARLRAVREQRIRPNKDDKVLTSWNALMISSLTRGSRILDKPHYLEAALKAGNFIRTTMMSESRLHRSWRDGKTHLDGYLDDYAFTLNAFIDLYEATFDTGWIDAARQLADHMTAQFWDNEEGGFFMTSNEATALIVRPKPGYDTQEPSGNSMAALGLLRLAVLCEVQDYRAKAEKTLIAHANRINLAPMGYLVMLKAVDFLVHSPKEIVLAGPLDDTALQALLHTARRQFLPNRVIAWGNPDDGSYADTARKIPLLANKAPVDGKATAYVCVNYTCQRPVHDANALQAQLRGQ